MLHHLHIPAYPLSDHIHDIFYYESSEAPYDVEKLLPDNTVYLIINFTEEPKKLYHDISLTAYHAYKKAWLSGMQRNYLVIEAKGVNRMLVVRFKPGMAYPLLNVPLTAISGHVFESDDVLGKEILVLREELMDTPDPGQKCRLVEAFMLQRLLGAVAVPLVVSYMVSRLSVPATSVSINELVIKTGYSHKHIIALFGKYVGLTPKHFARIQKFQHLLQDIERGRMFSWASLAHTHQFYDQAHFISEFKNFSGINPSQYLAEKGEYFNYLRVK